VAATTTPEDTAEARLPQPQAGGCPRCGTPTEPLQEYCLECGTRLPAATGPGAALAAGWRRRDWTGREWVWPVLVALVVAVLAAAAVLAIAAARDEPRARLIATQDPIGPPVTATTEPVVTASVPTTVATAPTTAPTQTAPPRRRSGLVPWPAGADGYTVILASLPTSGGRAAATSRAKAASDAGLQEVGVLNSSAYPSLQPRYFVIFAGIHETERQALATLLSARQAGYDAAYVKRIAK
jgi:hypothetical protein